MKVQTQGIGGVFLERAAAEELASKLTSGGWEVQREAPVGAMRVDLIARRGEEVVFYEFKLAGASAYDGWASQLLAYQIRTESSSTPTTSSISVWPAMSDTSEGGFWTRNSNSIRSTPSISRSICRGGRTIIRRNAAPCCRASFSGTTADVSGDAGLAVTLQTGAGEEIGSELFPFAFSAKLDLVAQRADEMDVTEVDLSSWYGDEQADDDDGPADQTSSDEDREPF